MASLRSRTTTTDIVVVSGPPAAGKSTLARALADRLGWPCLMRDPIQERIRAWMPDGGVLGALSYPILYDFAEELLASGTAFVFEANLRPAVDAERVAELVARFGAACTEVHLTAPADVLVRRCMARGTVPFSDEWRFRRSVAEGVWGPLGVGRLDAIDTGERWADAEALAVQFRTNRT